MTWTPNHTLVVACFVTACIVGGSVVGPPKPAHAAACTHDPIALVSTRASLAALCTLPENAPLVACMGVAP